VFPITGETFSKHPQLNPSLCRGGSLNLLFAAVGWGGGPDLGEWTEPKAKAKFYTVLQDRFYFQVKVLRGKAKEK